MGESRYQPSATRNGIALCLSGGGFRAALFHLGALRRLNEAGVLSRLTTITSVSGGSIAAGLLARMWATMTFQGGVARTFGAYETALREFCSHDIRTGPLVYKRLDPRNWLTLASDDHSATDFLAQAYSDSLVGDLRLGDLPEPGGGATPKFIFCASNLQTGASFEMSRERVGDYWIGYAHLPTMRVADAIAASSAFPLAFPPLIVRTDGVGFTGGKLSGDAHQPGFTQRLVLSDGGVYDNLGLEPVWKSHTAVLCSDGGKPFALDVDPGESAVPRLLRAQSVVENQAIALRKRWLVSSFERGVYDGAYWGISTDCSDYPHHGHGYGAKALARLRTVRTDMNPFSEGEQLVLMNHGWALTDAALRSYCRALTLMPLPPGVPPDQRLLANEDIALEKLG